MPLHSKTLQQPERKIQAVAPLTRRTTILIRKTATMTTTTMNTMVAMLTPTNPRQQPPQHLRHFRSSRRQPLSSRPPLLPQNHQATLCEAKATLMRPQPRHFPQFLQKPPMLSKAMQLRALSIVVLEFDMRVWGLICVHPHSCMRAGRAPFTHMLAGDVEVKISNCQTHPTTTTQATTTPHSHYLTRGRTPHALLTAFSRWC